MSDDIKTLREAAETLTSRCIIATTGRTGDDHRRMVQIEDALATLCRREILYRGALFLIELKRPADKTTKTRAGVLSDSQRETMPLMMAAGAKASAICFSLDDVERALLGFGIPLKEALS